MRVKTRAVWMAGAMGLIGVVFLLLVSAGAQTITIGFTVSRTGKLKVDSEEQLKGFELWRDQVNAAGGIKAGERRHQVRFITYDDESNPERVQQSYTRLIQNDAVEFLFSPYSSGLTAKAAAVTEQLGKIMMTTGAADDNTYKQGNKYLYQMFTPATEYLSSTLGALKAKGVNKVAFVYSDDSFSSLVAKDGRSRAELLGIKVVLDQSYSAGAKDFGAVIKALRSSGATALIGGGHYEDGEALARQLHDDKANLRSVVLLVAPDSPEFSKLGEVAYGVMVPSQWEPQSSFKQQIGPTGAAFVKAFQARYSAIPSYESAGGYAAGLVLQQAIEHCESTDTAKVASALDATDITTFFGRTRFATTARQHGLQVMHNMVLAQWQKDKSGKLGKQVVWPEPAKTANLVLISGR
ncbi:MAG: amino acid ABC transporter substrate-binding protein [Terriglobales bacterium]